VPPSLPARAKALAGFVYAWPDWIDTIIAGGASWASQPRQDHVVTRL
jgi:hypothetical protein